MKTIDARVMDSRNLRLKSSIGLKKGVNVRVIIASADRCDHSGRKAGLLETLKKIKIKGPVDFAGKVDSYTYGSKHE